VFQSNAQKKLHSLGYREFAFQNDITAELFEVPAHYTEDPTR